jgi:NADPH-dependent 2,4-dienoyl-CoA reductase/sulfur reductase-like enzyme
MTERQHRAVVVVGGGPAGLATLVEARRAGLDACLIEQRSQLHGPRRLIAAAHSSGADMCTDTVAWGIWGRELAVSTRSGPTRMLLADQVILATGAYERPAIFPGWSLPGVMTAGGARRLLEQGVAPGERVLVAGYGQWLATATAAMRSAGANVVASLHAAARPGRMVVRAEGECVLERAIVAPVDAEWSPRADTEQVVDVDTLVLAFGWLPESQLARLAGCAYSGSEYVHPAAVRDTWMRSSVPGIFVVGDSGGIGGPDVALEQGCLAGLGAAIDAGRVSEADASRRARPIVRRLTRHSGVDPGPRAGLFALADATTLVCRCEDVTAQQIADVLFDGSLEPAPAIAETRAGMGSCQGRNCASQIAAVISQHAGQPIQRVPPITPRPPVMPLPLGALAARPPEWAPLADRRRAG